MAIGDSVPYPAGDGQGERGRGTPHFSNLFVKSQPRGIRVGHVVARGGGEVADVVLQLIGRSEHEHRVLGPAGGAAQVADGREQHRERYGHHNHEQGACRHYAVGHSAKPHATLLYACGPTSSSPTAAGSEIRSLRPSSSTPPRASARDSRSCTPRLASGRR